MHRERGRLVIAAGILLWLGCSGNHERPLRHDLEPVAKRLPGLRSARAVAWSGGALGEGSAFQALGPSSFWMKGFVRASGTMQKAMVSADDWRPMEGPKPDAMPDLDVQGCNWLASENIDSSWSSAKVRGKFAWCAPGDFVYFSAVWGN